MFNTVNVNGWAVILQNPEFFEELKVVFVSNMIHFGKGTLPDVETGNDHILFKENIWKNSDM